MERSHRRILQRNFVRLRDSLAVNGELLGSLFGMGVFGTIEEMHAIQFAENGTERPRNIQVERLLAHLPHAGSKAFGHFCTALYASSSAANEELANLLQEDCESGEPEVQAASASPRDAQSSSQAPSSLPPRTQTAPSAVNAAGAAAAVTSSGATRLLHERPTDRSTTAPLQHPSADRTRSSASKEAGSDAGQSGQSPRQHQQTGTATDTPRSARDAMAVPSQVAPSAAAASKLVTPGWMPGASASGSSESSGMVWSPPLSPHAQLSSPTSPENAPASTGPLAAASVGGSSSSTIASSSSGSAEQAQATQVTTGSKAASSSSQAAGRTSRRSSLLLDSPVRTPLPSGKPTLIGVTPVASASFHRSPSQSSSGSLSAETSSSLSPSVSVTPLHRSASQSSTHSSLSAESSSPSPSVSLTSGAVLSSQHSNSGHGDSNTTASATASSPHSLSSSTLPSSPPATSTVQGSRQTSTSSEGSGGMSAQSRQNATPTTAAAATAPRVLSVVSLPGVGTSTGSEVLQRTHSEGQQPIVVTATDILHTPVARQHRPSTEGAQAVNLSGETPPPTEQTISELAQLVPSLSPSSQDRLISYGRSLAQSGSSSLIASPGPDAAQDGSGDDGASASSARLPVFNSAGSRVQAHVVSAHSSSSAIGVALVAVAGGDGATANGSGSNAVLDSNMSVTAAGVGQQPSNLTPLVYAAQSSATSTMLASASPQDSSQGPLPMRSLWPATGGNAAGAAAVATGATSSVLAAPAQVSITASQPVSSMLQRTETRPVSTASAAAAAAAAPPPPAAASAGSTLPVQEMGEHVNVFSGRHDYGLEAVLEEEMRRVHCMVQLMSDGGASLPHDFMVKTLTENEDGTIAVNEERLTDVLGRATCKVYIQRQLLEATQNDAPQALMQFLRRRGIRQEATTVFCDDEERPIEVHALTGETIAKQSRAPCHVLVRIVLKVKLQKFYSRLVELAVLQCLEDYGDVVETDAIRVHTRMSGSTDLIVEMSIMVAWRLYLLATAHPALFAGIGIMTMAIVGQPVVLCLFPTPQSLYAGLEPKEEAQSEEILRRLRDFVSATDAEDIRRQPNFERRLMLCVRLVFHNPLLLRTVRMIVDGATHDQVDDMQLNWLATHGSSTSAREFLAAADRGFVMKVRKAEQKQATRQVAAGGPIVGLPPLLDMKSLKAVAMTTTTSQPPASSSSSSSSPLLARLAKSQAELGARTAAQNQWITTEHPMTVTTHHQRHGDTDDDAKAGGSSARLFTAAHGESLFVAASQPPSVYRAPVRNLSKLGGGGGDVAVKWTQVPIPDAVAECCGLCSDDLNLYLVSLPTAEHQPSRRNEVYRFTANADKQHVGANESWTLLKGGISRISQRGTTVVQTEHGLHFLGGDTAGSDNEDTTKPSTTSTYHRLTDHHWLTSSPLPSPSSKDTERLQPLALPCTHGHATTRHGDIILTSDGGGGAEDNATRLQIGVRAPTSSSSQLKWLPGGTFPMETDRLASLVALDNTSLLVGVCRASSPSQQQQQSTCVVLAYDGASKALRKVANLPPVPACTGGEACSLAVCERKLYAFTSAASPPSHSDNEPLSKVSMHTLDLAGLV